MLVAETKLSAVFQHCFLPSHAFLVHACAASLPGLRGLDRLGWTHASPRWGRWRSPGTPGTGLAPGFGSRARSEALSPSYKGPFLVQLTPGPHPGCFHIFISHVQRIRCVFGHAEVTHISSGIGTLHLGRMTPPKPRTPHTSAVVSSRQRRPSFIAARSICNGD